MERSKRLLLSLLLLVGMTLTAVAQNQKISGTVILKVDNEPAIGATVREVGIPNNGTVTDFDGKFNITVKNGAKLEIQYVGTKTQIVAAKNGIEVFLEDDSETIEEVVIVGTVMRKSDLTGAVGMIDSKTLSERPVTNLNEAMQGRIAGVNISTNANPADDSSIKIRGINTINSGSDPIYVVDGQVMTNDFGGFSSINPNDVESVQVLKDASATALYGSRGANGVILITTKKARRGEGHINYDAFVTMTTVANRPSTMSAQQLGQLRADAFTNGYRLNNPSASEADIQNYVNNTIWGTNTIISADEMDTYTSGKSFDWLKQNLRTGVQHSHNLSFSKGTDKSNIFLSLNYVGTTGILGSSNQNKYSGRINADTEITPWLKIGTSTNYSYQVDNMHDNTVYTKALGGNPMLDYAPYQNPTTAYDATHQYWYYQALSSNYNNDFNPFTMKDVQYYRNRSHITSTNYLNIKFMEGLNFRSTFAIDMSNQKWAEYLPSNSPTTVRNEPQSATLGDARAKQERWARVNWQWDNTITFDKTIKQVHRLNAMLGTSATKTTGDYTKAQGMRFASDDLGYNYLGGASKYESTDIASDAYTQTLLSYILRGNYVYANKYYVTATARVDGSSKFAKGHKWGVFPSFALAWDMRQEKFLDNADWLDKLKLRLGFGVVGNQDITNYAYQSLYYMKAIRGSKNGVTIGQPSISLSDTRGTTALTWERQNQWNVGFDLGFLDNRINLSIDYFHIINDNLLMKHSLAPTSGFADTWENIGKVVNNGVEASINAAVIQTKDFQWNVSANISYDKNKVTKLYGATDKILNGTDRQGNIFLDESLNTIYAYQCGGIATEENRAQWDGIDQNGHTVAVGDLFVVGRNSDGKINENDKYIAGKTTPNVYGGFATDLSYKGFTLNAVFNYSIGAKRVTDYYEGLISSVGLSQASTDLMDRYSSSNPNGSLPRVVTNTSAYNGWKASECDFAVQNASYLRLSTLSLSYRFNDNVLKKLHLSNLRLYATANNVFCATKYKGFDPEQGDTGYPPCRSFTFGVNVSY